MRKILCLAASLALIINMACGKAIEETSEKAAEQQIEKQTGDRPTVDINENGMEITTSDADGDYTFKGGDCAEISDDFPVDY